MLFIHQVAAIISPLGDTDLSSTEAYAGKFLSQRRYTQLLCVVAAVLLTICATKIRQWMLFESIDMVNDFIPWYQHIVAYGRLRSLEASFTNYSPPYVYCLSVASLLNGRLPDQVIVKLAVFPFLIIGSFACWVLCRKLGCSRTRCFIAALIFPFLPEVALNSYKWGQSDVTYAALLLSFAALYLSNKRVLAVGVFGIALAFKLQAIFAAPVLLALVVSGEIPVYYLAMAPAAYFAMQIPSHLAGRSGTQLASVYQQQYGVFWYLSLGAPNPYFITSLHSKVQPFSAAISTIGILVAAAFSLWLVDYYRKHPLLRTPQGFVMLMTICLLIEPFLLPRMHERYFIAGNCFLFILAIRRKSVAPIAAVMQLAIVLCYLPFLEGRFAPRRELVTPFLLTTASIVLLFLSFRNQATCPDNMTP